MSCLGAGSQTVQQRWQSDPVGWQQRRTPTIRNGNRSRKWEYNLEMGLKVYNLEMGIEVGQDLPLLSGLFQASKRSLAPYVWRRYNKAVGRSEGNYSVGNHV